MTRRDRKILFTALAFLAVTIKGRDAKGVKASDQIRKLADLIEEFCAEQM